MNRIVNRVQVEEQEATTNNNTTQQNFRLVVMEKKTIYDTGEKRTCLANTTLLEL